MTPDDYELLLWLLGDRVMFLNLVLFAGLGAWAILSVFNIAYQRYQQYNEYKTDTEFWNDLLVVE